MKEQKGDRPPKWQSVRRDKLASVSKLIKMANARLAAMQGHEDLEIILPLKKASKIIKK
jgi:hypothetical protein